ncbi:ubiquitin-conjugating enzyme/RWD-like protein [Suillus ampliporus]|nr:ubiquitin-conjugating enzyme/RWD-like protein [Suillus ampliporus]
MPPALSNAMTIKRIHREVADAKKEDLGPIILAPSTDNLFRWAGTIPGPQGSPYEGGVFKIDIQLANDYPFSAPKVTFVTRIYHMNISDKGNICIDILKQNWSPALSLFKVMLSLSSLLTDPNPQDPLVPSIATEYVRNRVQHDRTAQRWTELYARSPAPVSAPAPAPIASASTVSVSVTAPTSMSTPLASTSTTQASGLGSSNVLAETINISDSDDELLRPPLTRKRPHGSSNEVDIDLVEAEQRVTRRRRTGGGGSMVPSVSRGSTAGAGEVIIIDD